MRTWEMMPEEEEAQRRSNAAAMSDFMNRLGTAVAASRTEPETTDDNGGNAWAELPPLFELGVSVMQAAAKLAGALNGTAWPPPLDVAALSIVRLKRGRALLDDAMLTAQWCEEQGHAVPGWLAEVRRELDASARACDQLIAELRERLARGFE